MSREPGPTQQALAAALRERILRGELAPGERIPGHRALVEAYGSSMVTVQRAVAALVEEGFVQSVPRTGRFVAEHPPHLNRVGLAFPGHPERIRTYRWTQYLEAVRAAAARLQGEDGWQLAEFFDVEPTDAGEPTAGYHRLLAEARARRLAAVVFCYSPHRLAGTELLRDRPVPTAYLGRTDRWGPSAMVDQERLLEEAAARLAARGRRRVAWVPSGRVDPDWLRPTLDALEARHGITSPGRWVHPLDQLQPKWVRHTLEALMAPAPRARPDGLVVLDDHLIGPIGAALAELGIAVPEDLLVVGYWNFPLPYAGELPVLRLGQDVVEQLRTVLRLLREDQAGPAPPRHVPLAPVDAVEAPRRHDAPARA